MAQMIEHLPSKLMALSSKLPTKGRMERSNKVNFKTEALPERKMDILH
jgi:hypothetical protein